MAWARPGFVVVHQQPAQVAAAIEKCRVRHSSCSPDIEVPQHAPWEAWSVAQHTAYLSCRDPGNAALDATSRAYFDSVHRGAHWGLAHPEPRLEQFNVKFCLLLAMLEETSEGHPC